MGDPSGEIHPPDARSLDSLFARNTRNYRIREEDRVGQGSIKQKFRQNIAALEVLQTVEREQRPARDDEKSALVKYVGWGAMPQLFDPTHEKWQKEQAKFSQLLSDEEQRSARASTLNAHYTAPPVIRAMYDMVQKFGFKEGRILEPAFGLGHFIGLMPESMHSRSLITGVEIDAITTRLARILYPDVDLHHRPYEETRIPDGFYDLAISNVPFGDYQPYDKRFNVHKFPIHDYYFASTLERVRPGGLIAFITSKGTLDKRNTGLRGYLAEKADLLGAIRLPNTAFKNNAHTEVTTDIVLLRKRFPGEPANGIAWLNSVRFETPKGELLLNEYYMAHPQMMLGTMELEGGMYGRDEATLVPDGRDLSAALQEAIQHLPQNVYQAPKQQETSTEGISILAPDEVKPNAYALADLPTGSAIAIREGDKLVVIDNLPGETRRRIRGLIKLRSAVRACLRSQVENAPSDEILETRRRLNQEYDYFVGRFGPVSERANTRAFCGDPDLPLLLSLEHFNEETCRATKSAIFRERTIQPPQQIETVATAKEALVVSLNELGRVDLDRMGGLLRKGPEDFLPELKGLLFLDPQSETWETDDAYLSGNVREKLAAAEAAALADSKFQDNVEALRAVQPVDLKATEIDARLGAVWIPEEDLQQFAAELLNLPDPQAVKIRHLPQLGSWFLEAEYMAKSSVANTTEWGTNRYPALKLIDDALNLRVPTVYDPGKKEGERVVNAAATEAAREKQFQIKERFSRWIWEDDERRERLVRLYNENLNNVCVRSFNGDHLTLPGASTIITLRPHQKAGIWRILQTPNTLLAHVVGAGKTYTMVAAGMEAKRLGLSQKPMFVVPNHMLGQFSSELLTLYPGAHILAATRDDFESSGRQQLFSRIATGTWDAVIVTHSGFERIPMSKESQEAMFKEQIEELQSAILQYSGSKDFKRAVKDLESAKKKLETKLKVLAAEDKKDATLTFEELGVDRLFVDEAHYFKNLFYITKMTRIAGLPNVSSQRAFDMLLKVRYIQKHNSGGVVFATGTPVANTMAEMFTMQRYLQENDLKCRSLHHFDGWAATYGEPVTAMELSPDGAGYRLNTRFARFVNVPELMQQFRQMADIQTAQMLKLPIPKLFQGKPVIVSAPVTPELKGLVASLAKRAERLKLGSVDPSEDNMLKITGEGRKAALDMRLVGRGRDHSQSKLSLAAKEIHAIWEQTKEHHSTQLVFCDLSTPKPGLKEFSAYDDLRAKLIQKGIPEEEIAFIQDYESDAEKAVLFKKVRFGHVRILMGSTQKMGTGTNVQERLIALHHLDAPWRPADIEQREGRILRQGNLNPEVKIFRYVTEGSFDAYMWGVLETKAKFIAQVMSNESHVRKIEDLDAPVLTYAEVKAIASGNPLVIEKAQVDSEIMRLNRLRSQHSEAVFVARNSIRRTSEEIPMMERKIDALKTDLSVRQDTKGDAFRIQLEGRTLDNRTEAGEILNRLVSKNHLNPKKTDLGSFAGFRLQLWPERSGEIMLADKYAYPATVSDSPLGTISSMEHVLRSMSERLAEYQKDLEQAKQRIKDLEPHAHKPFEHEEKLQSLLHRQNEIVSALDLRKNQASSGLAAEETPVAEESISVEVKDVIQNKRTSKIAIKI